MTDNTDVRSTTGEPDRQRSVMMALSALVTLLVAAWCLADGPFLFDVRGVTWVLIAGGLVVGAGLVASGFRRR
ncbi:hypothetical protein [Gordonia shandongensis]|uniref:hypothetical protein n=1 Tax=Gordonia shandongensis TaxID=376351 RepID=UPI0003FABE42|nr:hypothetical protein [Gordonia shandongensis]